MFLFLFRALFPCGDNMVCIIDDREDVWSYASNLIHVKPYHFFQHTGDINAPPGLDKHENDDKDGIDLTKMQEKNITKSSENKEPDDLNVTSKSENKETSDKNEIKQVLKTDENEKETSKNNNCIDEIKEKVDPNVTEKSEHNEISNLNEREKTTEEEAKEKNINCVEKIKEITNVDRNNKQTSEKNSCTIANISETLHEDKKISENSNFQKSEENLTEISNNELAKLNEEETIELEVENTKQLIEVKHDTIEAIKDETKNQTQENTQLNEVVEKDEDFKSEDIQDKINDSNLTNKTQNGSNKNINIKDQNENKNGKTPNELIEIEDPDDYLIYLEEILRIIHKSFYEKYEKMEIGQVPDLKKIIPEVRSNVLKGKRLVFSGLVPTHMKLEESKAYQVAKSLGATVTQDLESTTTHLVAVRPGTAKVNAGRRKKNLKIVTPDWLWSCAERWEHVDERLYPLNNKGSKNRHPPPHCSSPEHIQNYGEPQIIRKRTPSGRFMDTINPLMSFSSADIADMDREVEDIFNESESEGELNKGTLNDNRDMILQKLKTPKESDDESSSSEESLTGEHPHGWNPTNKKKRNREDQEQELEDESTADEYPSAKFRRGEELSSDLEFGGESNSEGSVEAPDEIDDGDWNMMGAALEREFLSSN